MKIKSFCVFVSALLMSALASIASAAPVDTYRAQDVHSFLLTNELVGNNVLRTTFIYLEEPAIPNAMATGTVVVHVSDYDYGDGIGGHVTFSAFASGQVPLAQMSIDQSLSTASASHVVLEGLQAVIDPDGAGEFVPAQFELSLVLNASDKKPINAMWNDTLDYGCVVYTFRSAEQRKNVIPTVLSVSIDGTEMMGGGEEVISAWNARSRNMFFSRTTKKECSS